MTQAMIPVGRLVKDYNYRRRKRALDLKESIKAHGILTPILVRPLDDGRHQLIAGYSRAEYFEELFGAEAEIPVLIRIMNDAEATAAMIIENKVRQDTTAIEDAEAATRLLGILNGNKEETAKRLGWSIKVLNARLAIMNATEEVRNAYIDEKILLGHVEILAALRREPQNKVLSIMLERPNVPTVAELLKMTQAALLSLEAAIFDKTDCAGCHYNTAQQQAMFEVSLSGINCSNSECYTNKTEAELEKRRVALTDTYQVVRIVRPGENQTLVPLRADGPKGVGAEQAQACRTCGDFGACISAAPDKLGKEFKDICFNATCNSEKVQARLDAEKAALAAEQASKSVSAGNMSAAASAAPAGDAKEAKAVGNREATTKVLASSEPRNAVREYREDTWRLILARAAVKLPVEKNRALLLAICLYASRNLDGNSAAAAISKLVGVDLNRSDAPALAMQLMSMETPNLAIALQNLPAHMSKDLDIKAVTGFLKAAGTEIESYWALNQDFCDLLTKTELDAICVELGIDKAMGKEYAKTKNGSKADFVKAALTVKDFPYKGSVPAIMRWKV